MCSQPHNLTLVFMGNVADPRPLDPGVVLLFVNESDVA